MLHSSFAIIQEAVSESEQDGLCRVPALVFRHHVLPWLNQGDLRSLRLVNKQFAELYKATARSLTVRICREALDGLQHSPEPSTAGLAAAPSRFAARYPSVCHFNLDGDPHPLTLLPGGADVARLIRLLGPQPTQTCLTLHGPIHIPLLTSLGGLPDASLGSVDRGRGAVSVTRNGAEMARGGQDGLYGEARPAMLAPPTASVSNAPPAPTTHTNTTTTTAATPPGQAVAERNPDAAAAEWPLRVGAVDPSSETTDAESEAAAIARALASTLPKLQDLRLVSDQRWTVHVPRPGAPGGDSDGGAGPSGLVQGGGGRAARVRQSTAGWRRGAVGRSIIAPQPLLLGLAEELLASAEGGGGGGGRAEPFEPGGAVGCTTSTKRDSSADTRVSFGGEGGGSRCGRSSSSGGGSGGGGVVVVVGGGGDVTSMASGIAAAGVSTNANVAAGAAVGLQSLSINSWQRSADPFEAELLDLHLPYMPEVLLDFRAVAAAAAAAAASGSSDMHRGIRPAAAPPVHPILRLQPLRPPPSAPSPQSPGHPLLHLTALELRGVSVHPALLAGLRELRLLTRLALSVSCARPYEPLITALPALKLLRDLHLFLHVPSSPPLPLAAPPSQQQQQPQRRQQSTALSGASWTQGRRTVESEMVACYWHADGGGGGGRQAPPDCTASQLAAAVSQCGRLVSLGLPGEELDHDMPVLLQALPALTHLEARQLGSWELAGPHTALRSLTLTMAWPHHVVSLLPSLPRLEALRADMFLHAEGSARGRDEGSGKMRAGDRESLRRGCGGRSRRPAAVYDTDSEADGGGVGELYVQLAALAAALEGVRHVELQLSVMRRQPWEWSLVLRELAAVRGLRGLTLRMPQRDSGPPLRTSHVVTICRSMRGLRRLTLLLAQGGCSRVGVKALQALQYLPHLELLQLHLGGAWEGVDGEGAQEGGVGLGRGRGASQGVACGGGLSGAGGSTQSKGCRRRGGRQDDGGKGNGGAAVAGCSDGRTEMPGSRRQQRQLRRQQQQQQSAGRRFDSDGDNGDCDEHDGAAVTDRPGMGTGMASARGPTDGESAAPHAAPPPPPRSLGVGERLTTLPPPPPLPESRTARAVLEAARGLGYGRPGRYGEVSGSSGGGSTSSNSDDDGSEDVEANSDGGDGRGSAGCSDGDGGDGEAACNRDRGCGAAGSAATSGATAHGDDVQGEGRGLGEGRRPGLGKAVQLQVDFLSSSQAEEVNTVLRWEGRPVVVRSGLEPRWVWAEAAGLSG